MQNNDPMAQGVWQANPFAIAGNNQYPPGQTTLPPQNLQQIQYNTNQNPPPPPIPPFPNQPEENPNQNPQQQNFVAHPQQNLNQGQVPGHQVYPPQEQISRSNEYFPESENYPQKNPGQLEYPPPKVGQHIGFLPYAEQTGNGSLGREGETFHQPHENVPQPQPFSQPGSYHVGNTTNMNDYSQAPQNIQAPENGGSIQSLPPFENLEGSGNQNQQAQVASQFLGNYPGSNNQQWQGSNYGGGGSNTENYPHGSYEKTSELEKNFSEFNISSSNGHHFNQHQQHSMPSTSQPGQDMNWNSGASGHPGYGNQPSQHFNKHPQNYYPNIPTKSAQSQGYHSSYQNQNSYPGQRQQMNYAYRPEPQGRYDPAYYPHDIRGATRRKADDVRYESEDEEEESEEEVQVRKTKSTKTKPSSSGGKSGSSKGGKTGGKAEQTKTPSSGKRGGGKTSPPPTKKQTKVVVKDLHSFGNMEELTSRSKTYKTLTKYATNSSGLPKGSNTEVKIHKIHKIDSGPTKFKEQVLLWFRTTPGSVKKLEKKEDGCVAFYDRLCRVLKVKPEEVTQPHRQLVLLCSVALGKVNEHRSGYKVWAQRELPTGFNSIKGMGEFTPNSKDDEEVDSVTIPCGKTVKHGVYPKYEMEYNEYLIYECKRVKVKYAVDVEIIPAAEDSDSN